jgi:hypothetical protein
MVFFRFVSFVINAFPSKLHQFPIRSFSKSNGFEQDVYKQ